jgi:uncharacterized protein YdeI (YjbR/CyaY-like superfamily)
MVDFLAKDREDWSNWLKENHLKEEKVTLIKYKKHTGKPIIDNKDAMTEAIRFGWIDTTTHRIDDDKYAQTFVKRNQNSKWSVNTLARGKELFEKGLMSEHGIKKYKEGLAKGAYDRDLPKNPEVPEDLIKILNKNLKAKEKFEKLSSSVRKMYLRHIIRAKLPETREKRINNLIENLTKEPYVR